MSDGVERRREFEATGRAEVGAKGRFVEFNFLRTLFTCLTNSWTNSNSSDTIGKVSGHVYLFFFVDSTCAPGVWYIPTPRGSVTAVAAHDVTTSTATAAPRRRKATLAPLFRRPRQVDHYYYWRCTTRFVSGSFRLQYIPIGFKTPGAWFQNIIPHLLVIQGVERALPHQLFSYP